MRLRILLTSARSAGMGRARHRISRRACSKDSMRLGVASHRPGTHQRLVFPHPGLLVLVGAECRQARHQRAGIARGAQAHVDLVQRPGVGGNGKQVQQLSNQTVQELGSRSGQIVDEHQIQVGIRAEFQATELAVAHRD